MGGRIALAVGILAAGAAADPLQFDVGGSFKSIASYQRLRHEGVFSDNEYPGTEQRLRLEGAVSYDWWRVEAAHELSFTWQKQVTSTIPVPEFTPTSAWNAQSTITSSETTLLTQRLDRAFVQISHGQVELRVGKQIIDEGVGRIFSAVSQVPRYAFVY